MASNKQNKNLVLGSTIIHIDAVLTAAGWSIEVVPAGEVDPNSEVPVVGIKITDTRRWNLESGSTTLAGEYRFEVIVYAATDSQMGDVEDFIINNLHGIDIVDLNTAMPGDVDYDAVTQRLAGGSASGIRSSVINQEENIVKITFELQVDANLV